ncbi:DUF2953 domain-containing protein [Pseudoneobacillus sp. C159]
MKWLIIALIILLVLIIILFWSKLSILLDYYHGNDNDHLKITFKIWFGLIKYKKEIPVIKIDDNSPTIVLKEKSKQGMKDTQIGKKDIVESIDSTKWLLRHVVNLHTIVRTFFKKVSVKRVEWHTNIGVGDAADTAVLTGAIWAAKGSLIGLISHYFRLLEMPKMTVTPYFNHKISQLSFKCMFQFRIGQAMIAGLKLMKMWKGGRPKLKTKPLSVQSRKA